MATLPCVKIPFVDLRAQFETIEPEIRAAIDAVLADTAFIGGPFVEAFERDFAAACGTRLAVGVSNGTDALILALRALGIGPGDEVITVPNTFIATTEAISAVGASVRFADVDESSANLDPSAFAAAIGARTKAVIPVHLYGRPAEMDAITKIAREHGLAVVGDCAQAHGARFRGRPIASQCDIACFSFYPGKNLGAYGDAGAVATDDDALASEVARLADHGRADKYTHAVEGYNCRLDGLQAAILSVKLRHLEAWSEGRRRVARRYGELLASVDGVTPPHDEPHHTPVYHLYVVRLANRDRVAKALADAGVATGVHYPIPLHLQPAYRRLGLSQGDFPIAERLADEILSLPIYPELDDERIEYVVSHLKAGL
jgi:dTDP-4-amino-4,6-dideoxygalactose transaminase